MPGMFSRFGKAAMGYATTGAAYGVAGHQLLGEAAGKLGRAAIYGGAAGAAWGAMSDNTSVIGGAMMGAGLGAGGLRYGGRGMAIGKVAREAGMGYAKSAGYGALSAGKLAYQDVRAAGSRIMSNKAVSRVASSLKNWRS